MMKKSTLLFLLIGLFSFGLTTPNCQAWLAKERAAMDADPVLWPGTCTMAWGVNDNGPWKVCKDNCSSDETPNLDCTQCLTHKEARREYCIYLRNGGGRCHEDPKGETE